MPVTVAGFQLRRDFSEAFGKGHKIFRSFPQQNAEILSHIVPSHRGTKFHIFVYKIIAYRSILEALLQCPKILQYSGIQFSPRLQPHSHGPVHVRLPLLAEQVHKKQMLKITRCFAATTVFCSLGTTNGTGPLFQRVAILMVS